MTCQSTGRVGPAALSARGTEQIAISRKLCGSGTAAEYHFQTQSAFQDQTPPEEIRPSREQRQGTGFA